MFFDFFLFFSFFHYDFRCFQCPIFFKDFSKTKNNYGNKHRVKETEQIQIKHMLAIFSNSCVRTFVMCLKNSKVLGWIGRSGTASA